MHRDTKSNKYAKERDYSMSLALSLQGGSRYVMIGSSLTNKGVAWRCFAEVV